MVPNRYLSRWLARLGLVVVVALGVGVVPLFAQNYSSSSTSSKGTASSSMSNSTSSNQTMSPLPVSRASMVADARDMVLKYWNAIAYRDTQKLDSQFATDAQVVWIGGQLDGTYKGQTSIDNLWSQFASLTPLTTFQIKHVWYAVSGGNPTVSEDVVLTPLAGSTEPVQISSTLVYNKDNKIVNEVWQRI